MQVAIVHYWLLGMRGGEKVLEALCRMFPEADLFTLFYDPERVSPLIRSRRVTASFLNRWKNHHRSLLPLMPVALESFDLRGYDLVVSSESGPAKGVLTQSRTRHVCYCHSPMRYLWELYPDYLHEWTPQRWKKALLAPLSSYLRMWDLSTAARVDTFVANSNNVRRRIARTYRRDAQVVYPPVAVESFYSNKSEDYYLIVSEFVAYKRIDQAVRVFSSTGRRLRIVGDGPEYGALRKLAGPSVEFCGHVPDDQLRELYSRSRAFLLPGEEDFGITAVEALASGKPIIALGRGGICEIASENAPFTGVFYHETSDAALLQAVERFETQEPHFDPLAAQESAKRFAESRFEQDFRAALDNVEAGIFL